MFNVTNIIIFFFIHTLTHYVILFTYSHSLCNYSVSTLSRGFYIKGGYFLGRGVDSEMVANRPRPRSEMFKKGVYSGREG